MSYVDGTKPVDVIINLITKRLEFCKMLELVIRRIEILKVLQGKEMRTGELAEYFGVDERTIRSDQC